MKLKRLAYLLSALGAVELVACAAVSAQEAFVPCPEMEMLNSVDWFVASNAGVDMPSLPPAPPPPEMPFPPQEAFGPGPGPGPQIAHFPGHHGPGGAMLFGGLTNDVSFSDDQLEKIFQLKQDCMDKTGPKMAELFAQHRALRDLLTQPNTDKSKAQEIQGKINSLRGDIANYRLEQQIGLLGVLTPEQRKELRRNFVKRADFGPGAMMMRWKHCKKHSEG